MKKITEEEKEFLCDYLNERGGINCEEGEAFDSIMQLIDPERYDKAGELMAKLMNEIKADFIRNEKRKERRKVLKIAKNAKILETKKQNDNSINPAAVVVENKSFWQKFIELFITGDRDQFKQETYSSDRLSQQQIDYFASDAGQRNSYWRMNIK